MVGNFHGVLILCLWLIWHPQKVMPVQLPTTGASGGGGRGQSIVEAWPTVLHASK